MRDPAEGDKREIAAYWAGNPQTYGEEHGGTAFRVGEQLTPLDFKSREFFEHADQTLFEWNAHLHTEAGPFGEVYPYARYAGHDVLEIGCGMGGMAKLWAERGANITAVDLNHVAIEQTTRRFALYGLSGTIQQEDANRLSFYDRRFDYVYSWGVLHHSPNLERSVAELARVLKPGGEFGVMLYHRRSFLYWHQIRYMEGLVHGERRFLDPLALASRYTDGNRQEGNPHTWPITSREARTLFGPYASRLDISVICTQVDAETALIMPGLARRIPRAIKKAWARRWGWSLWITGTRA